MARRSRNYHLFYRSHRVWSNCIFFFQATYHQAVPHHDAFMQKSYASLKKRPQWQKRKKKHLNLCLCRERNDDWLGPHHIMHQAASSSKARKYFLDEWWGKGKFTHTFRVHLHGTDSTLVIKMFKTCFCKFDEDPPPHKKHELKRSASGPAPPLLTHLAKLGMADYTSQGQTHFGWR